MITIDPIFPIILKTAKTTFDNAKKTGGNPGGGGSPSDDGSTMKFFIAAVIVSYVAFSGAVSGKMQSGREISWQEFSGQLLESGQVDRIMIANKTTAR